MRALLPLQPSLRIVKGAYLEPPSIAFPRKVDVDRNYVRLLELGLREGRFTAIATHDDAIIAHATEFVRRERSHPSASSSRCCMACGRVCKQISSGAAMVCASRCRSARSGSRISCAGLPSGRPTCCSCYARCGADERAIGAPGLNGVFMSAHLTHGVNCATLTPLDDAGNAQLDLLAEHCRWLLEAGCESIVLLGTTGEAASFTAAERRAIFEGVLARGTAPRQADRRHGLLRRRRYGGAERARVWRAASFACSMLPPFYYKNLAETGVVSAFARAIETVGDERLRVYLYQIPQLTGVSLGATADRGVDGSVPDHRSPA